MSIQHDMNLIRKYFVPGLLVFCTLLLSFWLLMSKASERPYESFGLTPKDFAAFQPMVEGWTVGAMPIAPNSHIDDNNIAWYSVERAVPQTASVSRLFVRLVHGYNMPMCMKMKYYAVEKIQDYRVHSTPDPKLQAAYRYFASKTQQGDYSIPRGYPLPVQMWRLTSSVGTVSIWVTTMIRADDFTPTGEDICTMAYPRVEFPGDPGWAPRGFGVDDLKDPLFAFKRWYHKAWDYSQWDVLTFFKLRRKARPSEELLTYATMTDVMPSNGIEDRCIQDLLDIHAVMLGELQRWRKISDRFTE